MMRWSVWLCMLWCSAGVVWAQTDELPDLDAIDPDTFTVESDMLGAYSTGWFPQPHRAYTLNFMIVNGNVWDQAWGLRSSALVPTAFSYAHHNPYGDSDQREIIKPFATIDDSDSEEDDYPETDYDEYSLCFTANLPFPAVLRAEAGLLVTDGLLFSSDRTRSFLSYSGVRQNFHEVQVAHREEWLLKGGVGIDIPVYGAFVQVDDVSISSYYYVHGSISGLLLLSGKGTQYAQIADVKDRLRYGNGTDTVQLRPRGEWEGVSTFRTALTVGIGWHVSAQFAVFRVEPFVAFSPTSILRDAKWTQYMAGIRVALGFQWGTGK